MGRIHPTAVLDGAARVAADVQVGPFCVVGPEVVIGAGAVLEPHAVVVGRTSVGPRCRIGSFAVLGGAPQDRRHEGASGPVELGADVVVREHVTIHGGSSGGRGVTRVGDGSVLMVGSHVGHDCEVGAGCTLVNCVLLGGHAQLGEGAFVGGGTTVHQFVRIGAMAHVGGASAVERDVVPWGLALGNRAVLRGPNLVGMQRAGLEPEAIRAAQALWRDLFGPGEAPLAARIAAARGGDHGPVGRAVFAFLDAPSRRGLLPTAPSGR